MIGLAEALFENDSEWPDELAFKKGDILRVINQTPSSDVADGWWVCSDHRGNRGIAPANRLKMIHTFTSTYKNRVITPRRFGDVFLHNNVVGEANTTSFLDDDDYFRRVNVENPTSLVVDDDEMSASLRRMRFWQVADPVETTTFFSPQTVRRQSSGISVVDDDIFKNFASLKRGNFNNPAIRNVSVRQDVTDSHFSAGRKSPPPPPQRRGGLQKNDLDEDLKKFFVSQLASMEDPVKIVNPLYESQIQTVRTSLNRVSTVGDTNDGTTAMRRQKQIFADQLAQLRNAGMNNRLRNFDYPKPYRPILPNNSTGSDNGSNSDRSSSMSDSTPSSVYSNRATMQNGGVSTNGTLERFGNISLATRHSPVIGRVADYPSADRKHNATNVTLNGSNVTSNGINVILNGSTNGINVTLNGTPIKQTTTTTTNGEIDSLSISSVDSKDSDYQELLQSAELPPMNSIEASGRLVSLRQNLQISVRHLCSFTTRNWRRKDFLNDNLSEICTTCQQTVDYLKSFVDFAVGSFVNLSRRRDDDESSSKRLAHLIRPLRRSLNLLTKLRQTLDDDGWAVEKFIRDINGGTDNLDQFIAIARQTPEDARQVASCIHTNSNSIFITPDTTADQRVVEEDELIDNSDEEGSLFDDYDFVDGKHSTTNGTENGMGRQVLTSSTTSFDSTIELGAEDKQIVKFYSPQVNNHIEYLCKAIDEFLASVEKNQPPKVFVSNSRFVVLASHKLIYIGDNIAQCLRNRDIGDKIKESSDKLCDILKFCVAATKHAAMQYPMIPSVQTMLDSMVNVSQAAHELTLLINQVAKM